MTDQVDTTYDAVPDELKALPQWVLWRYETRDGKQTKVPYNARNMARARSTHPDTWTSFENALRLMQARNRLSPNKPFGLGFVFSPDDPYCGIDIDRGCDERGQPTEFALHILNDILGAETPGFYDFYLEHSPSGTGYHIICRAKWPGENGMNNQRLGLEAYDQGRYFTITGRSINSLPANEPLSDAQDAVNRLYAEYVTQPTNSDTKPADGDPGEREGQSRSVSHSDVSDAQTDLTRASEPQTWKDLQLVVDSDAEPPAMKFADLFQLKNFKATWEHTRDTRGWENASQSGYDMAVGRFAQEAGWSDQEICNLLIAHRRHHDAGRLDRMDYYQRTVFKLRQTVRHQEALEALDEADDLTPEDKPMIRQLIMELTGLKVERYVQHSRSPASYTVHLAPLPGETHREKVVLPTSADARSQSAWQDIAQEMLGAPFFALKPAKWHKFLKCLAVLCEYDEIPEASHTEELLSLLRRYARLANTLNDGEQPDADAIRDQHAMRRGDELLFSLGDFKEWFATHSNGAPYKGIIGRLRAAGGAQDMLVSTDDCGRRTRRRYWRINLADD